ncbi:MAG: hypothetical protein LRY33_02320 [Parabacteroides chartae]|nr:hypothetical protein [Parabacteroides chartae]
MKKNLAFIILLVSVLFSACEDNRMEGMMDDQFYLLKNGDYILKPTGRRVWLISKFQYTKVGWALPAER